MGGLYVAYLVGSNNIWNLTQSTVAAVGAATGFRWVSLKADLCAYLVTLVYWFGAFVFGCYVHNPDRSNRKVVETALRLYADRMDPGEQNDFRAILWVADDDATSLKNLCDYVPSGSVPSRNNVPIGEGIVGLAWRTRSLEAEFIYGNKPPAEYESWLVTKWGFTPEVAKKIRKDRTFFGGIPLQYDNEVLGVIFCDSKHPPGSFTLEEFKETTEAILPFLELLLAHQIRSDKFQA